MSASVVGHAKAELMKCMEFGISLPLGGWAVDLIGWGRGGAGPCLLSCWRLSCRKYIVGCKVMRCVLCLHYCLADELILTCEKGGLGLMWKGVFREL